MDTFKKQTLNDLGWELSFSYELGKKKIQRCNKKRLRKLSRTRLKRNLQNKEGLD